MAGPVPEQRRRRRRSHRTPGAAPTPGMERSRRLVRRDRGCWAEVRMMEFGKLVPQMLFDIFTRFVPGAVLLCSWIIFLGQDDWRRLLDSLLGGNLDDGNALPVSMLALLFLSFLLGYLLAPFARGMQRLNEAPPLVSKAIRRR